MSTQGTSIKLLHSVVEVMFARHGDRATADAYRLQLGRILDVFVSKLSFMKSQIPKLLMAGAPCAGASPILHDSPVGNCQSAALCMALDMCFAVLADEAQCHGHYMFGCVC